MDDAWICPGLDILVGLIAEVRALPADFVRHARGCEHCFFWTSHTLAIRKAIYATDRLFHTQCPPNYHFERLLFCAIRGLKIDGVKRIDRDDYHFNQSDVRDLAATADHVGRGNANYCNLCRLYYDALFDATLEYQKYYEERLRAGEEIEAPEDTSQQFECERIGYDPTKKPN